MFNKVILSGRLTADPELRHTTNNIPVTSFSIAVNGRYRTGKEPHVDFIKIVAWRHSAEFITKYFQKGSMIEIVGSIHTRIYEDKEAGKNRTAFEVIAEEVQFGESKRKDANSDAEGADVTDPTYEGLEEFVEVPDDMDEIPL